MKSKSIFSILFAVFFHTFLFSQQSESNTYKFKGNVYDAFTIKIDASSINHFSIGENINLTKHDVLLDSIPKDDWFLTTAGIVDTACMPLGYYVNDAKLLQDVNLSAGVGNFYLKPNGILFFTDNDANICGSNKIKNKKDIKLAIQSGPMLIINSSIHPKFNQNSTSKFIRSGVGIYKNKKGEKFIVFSISKQPVNFYNFADYFLTHLNCTTALCLESQRSVMSIPFLPNDTDNLENIVCRYIIFKN